MKNAWPRGYLLQLNYELYNIALAESDLRLGLLCRLKAREQLING
jgi:hypothetical protein